MKEWLDGGDQKAHVKMAKNIVKTNTYGVRAGGLFLNQEKVISLFANGGPRVHP
ncbi:hypothetical protein [Burkholderia sp. lig30]|jgi:hypothetical protein|uniref:hypothetical protein n=1 Tax=Burkholderia sp. lig30 TaxID=1192124 RepID=UPI0013666E23|nr:hypothetical protein [Burkholderia sp. lig30]